MTNEEAIKLLQDVKDRVGCFEWIEEEEGEALDYAIKALKEIDDIKEAYRIMRGDL